MISLILALLSIILLVLLYISFKLRGRFQDIDRRFEKIDLNFMKNNASLETLKEKGLEIQNTLSLSAVHFEYPVFFGGWSIDSFLAKLLVQKLLEYRPNVILEIGSGSSTILIEKCIKILGYHPDHIVIDHESHYLDITKNLAEKNGLNSCIEFNLCPLGIIDNNDSLWYQGIPEILKNRKIDLLIIDGPPESTCHLARYPALPVLHKYLSQECLILLDDANRDDEKLIISKWMTLDKSFKLELITEGHGVAILSRSNASL